MINRILQKDIEESLKQFPVVGILGSRQVGKTSIAKIIQKKIPNSVYLDLELPSDFNKLNEAELYLEQYLNKLVIIDEIQQKPDLFLLLRGLVDKNRKPGRFIILGSSSPDLIKKSSESLAGRIIYHHLSPLLINEVGVKYLDKLWIRGGYPESYLAENDKNSLKWREAFISTFIESDIPKFGINISSSLLKRFWFMLSHLHGQLWNSSKIAASLGVSPPTTKHYLDILEDTFIIRQLQPYFFNIKKRLIKSPKIYFRDSGILHSVHNIFNKEDLLNNPIAGFSWEGFILEQIINIIPTNYGKYFYKTAAGAEVDLIITKGNKILVCIEIKLSLSPELTQGFYNAMSDLKCKEGIVIYPGSEDYILNEKVKVFSLKGILEYLKGL